MGIGIGIGKGIGVGITRDFANGVFTNTLSLLFDGVDEFVDSLGTVSAFSFIQNTGVFTISVWAKLSDNTAIDGNSYMGNNSGSAGEKGFAFLYDNRAGFTKQIRMLITRGVATIIDSATTINAITDNDWHNIIITGDGTNVFFYIDNVKETGSGTMSTLSTGDSTNVLQFARINNVATILMDGNEDEISIWNDTLTDAEASEIFNSGVPNDLLTHSAVSDLVGWWRMGDGDTFPTILDNSVNSNDGTMTNMEAGDIVTDVP